jgi:hypothetical protein
MTVTIYPRNRYLERVGGEIDDYFELTVQKAWEGAGSWDLAMPANHPRAADLLATKAGILIDLDSEYLTSGPVRWYRFEEKGSGPVLHIGGPNDSGYLYERRAEPCIPSYGVVETLSNGLARNVAFASSAYDSQAGIHAEAVIKHYVDYALGSNAVSDRQLAQFSIAPDLHRGPPVSVQARFDKLSDQLKAIARIGNGRYSMGWGITQVDQTLVFDVAEPELDFAMEFSTSAGTLKEFVYERNAPTANDQLVAGQGEGVDRTFYLGRNQPSIDEWGLIEAELRDRRDTDETDKLKDTLDEELAKSAERLAITLTPAETEARQYRRNWDAGHIGFVNIAGYTFTELIRTVTLKWKQGAPVEITPFIGTPDVLPWNALEVVANQRALSQRTSQLERR